MLTVRAPAKINLTLEVLGKRGDGFHEIRSIVQSAGLFDTLRFRLSDGISFHSDMPEWNAEKSLLSKAVRLLKDATGCARGVRIEVEKRIPVTSGLGGDSSDAAAVLRGLNELWELDLPPDGMREIAGRLGSDVFFFLNGGTALVEGRGEVVTPLPSFPAMQAVLAVPPVPRPEEKTGQLYGSLEAGHYTGGEITGRLADVLKAGGAFEPSLLFNTFENVAFGIFPGLDTARGHILSMGAPFVHLAGSGPTLFTLLDDRERAEELCSLLGKQNMEAHLAETPAGVD
jgi:4-diphosphocytidyl-2-C-methyl-D-erythritol kinase